VKALALQDALRTLSQQGKLFEINEELSPEIEIPWLSIELAKLRDNALLYNQVSKKDFRITTNLFYRKLHVMLNAESEEQIINRASKIITLIEPIVGMGRDKLHLLASLAWIADYYPETRVSLGPSTKILQGYELDLTTLPAFKHSSLEEYPVMPNPVIVATLASRGESDLSIQRVQLVDEKTMIIHVPRNSRLQFLIEEASKRGENLQAAVVLGAPPSLYPPAHLSWMSFTEKILLGGVISETKLAIAKLEGEMYVPVPAEAIILGEIVPGDERPEGKMLYEDGEVIGGSPMPVMHAKKLIVKNPSTLYYSTIHPTRSDTAELYKLLSKLLLLKYKDLLPDVLDVTFLGEDAFRTVVVKVDATHRERLINAGINALSLSKLLNPYTDTVILVGPEVDTTDASSLIKALIENVDPDKDIIKIESPGYEPLSRKEKRGSLVILATCPNEPRKPRKIEARLEATPRSREFLQGLLAKVTKEQL
jgi:4-hydroxy-3-polyprenylbenzoate decarboxylase